jgi:hypothetical protein
VKRGSRTRSGDDPTHIVRIVTEHIVQIVTAAMQSYPSYLKES